jgi:hypothetical protein
VRHALVSREVGKAIKTPVSPPTLVRTVSSHRFFIKDNPNRPAQSTTLLRLFLLVRQNDMRLTCAACRHTRPCGHPTRLSCGRGFYLDKAPSRRRGCHRACPVEVHVQLYGRSKWHARHVDSAFTRPAARRKYRSMPVAAGLGRPRRGSASRQKDAPQNPASDFVRCAPGSVGRHQGRATLLM